MNEPAAETNETLIEATHGFRALAWREIWAYRDLLWLLVWRDFSTRYKQTVLGPLWHVLQPLMTMFIFTVVFSHVAKLDTDDLPPTLFYLAGLLAWNYFAQIFNATSSTLVANAGLFGKVYFPRLVVPLSAVIANFVSFAIQFGTFVLYFLLFRASHIESTVGPNASALLLPGVLLQLGALGLGVGLWLAALTAKFRDFAVLSGFLLQLWMYVTPLIYPLSKVPSQWRHFVALNPVAVPVESFRYMLLGTGSVTPSLYAISLGMTLVALVSGLVVFQRVEKTFIDTV